MAMGPPERNPQMHAKKHSAVLTTRRPRIRRKAPRVDGILAVLFLLVFFFVLVQRLEAQTPKIALETTVTGLSQPVYFTTVKDGTNRRFVVEQTGQIRVLQPGSSNFTTFLDI